MTETAKPSDPAKWYKLHETGREYAAAQTVLNFSGRFAHDNNKIEDLRRTLGLNFAVEQDSDRSDHYPSVHQSSSPSDHGTLYMRCPVGKDSVGTPDASFRPADASEITGEDLHILGQKMVYPPAIGISPTKKSQQAPAAETPFQLIM